MSLAYVIAAMSTIYLPLIVFFCSSSSVLLGNSMDTITRLKCTSNGANHIINMQQLMYG